MTSEHRSASRVGEGSANFPILLFSRIIAVTLLAMALSGCARDVPPISCAGPVEFAHLQSNSNASPFDCFSDQALAGIKVVRENIAVWSSWSIFGQLFIVAASILATIAIALKQVNWFQPIGLVAGALATGITSALATFQVTSNIDKLVNVIYQMTTVTNKFDFDAETLMANRSPEQVKEAIKTDEKFRKDATELTFKFVNDWAKIKIETFRPPTARAPNNESQTPPK